MPSLSPLCGSELQESGSQVFTAVRGGENGESHSPRPLRHLSFGSECGLYSSAGITLPRFLRPASACFPSFLRHECLLSLMFECRFLVLHLAHLCRKVWAPPERESSGSSGALLSSLPASVPLPAVPLYLSPPGDSAAPATGLSKRQALLGEAWS